MLHIALSNNVATGYNHIIYNMYTLDGRLLYLYMRLNFVEDQIYNYGFTFVAFVYNGTIIIIIMRIKSALD